MSYSAHAGLALAVGPLRLRTGPAGDWSVPDEQFAVTYHGPALEAGTMEVRQLAPSLLAVADLVQEANRLGNPGGSPPAVQIVATRPGSFIVDLLLTDAVTMVDRALDLFAGRAVTATVNLSGLVTIALGAMELIRRLRGRRIARQNETRPGYVRLTFDDDTTLEVPTQSVALARDLAFRQAARDLVQPLGSEGITRIVLSRGPATGSPSRRRTCRPSQSPTLSTSCSATRAGRSSSACSTWRSCTATSGGCPTARTASTPHCRTSTSSAAWRLTRRSLPPGTSCAYASVRSSGEATARSATSTSSSR